MTLKRATRWFSGVLRWSNFPFPAYLISPHKHLGSVLSLGWLPGKLNGTLLQPAKTEVLHRHDAETWKQAAISWQEVWSSSSVTTFMFPLVPNSDWTDRYKTSPIIGYKSWKENKWESLRTRGNTNISAPTFLFHSSISIPSYSWVQSRRGGGLSLSRRSEGKGMWHPGQVAHWSQGPVSFHFSTVRNDYKTMSCTLCKFQAMGIKVTWRIIWNLSAGFILYILNP